MKRDQMNERDTETRAGAELRDGIMAAPVESTFELILTSLEVKKLIEFDSYGNVAIA